MDKSTIHNFIDKVIGKKGLLRIPSWWMRKVLMQIADWVQEGDDANDKKIEKVKKEADGKISTLDNNIKTALVELKKSLHTQRCFIVKNGANTGYVVVDGVSQDIPANTQKVITFTNNFKFAPDTGLRNQPIEFIGLAVTDTSSFTDMGRMFYDCSGLTSLDLSGIDTSAVTGMRSMFSYCKGLASLDLSGIDTSAVTDMGWMFSSSSSLTSLDLSGFNTSAVTNMDMMFYECRGLTSLILGPNFFKTSNVTNVDFSYLAKWTNDTVVTSLVTNSYDRATAGLKTMTLQLSANTKAALTDEQKATITAKGYTIA